MDYAEDKCEDRKNQPKTGTNTANSEESIGEDKSTLSNNVSEDSIIIFH